MRQKTIPYTPVAKCCFKSENASYSCPIPEFTISFSGGGHVELNIFLIIFALILVSEPLTLVNT